MDEGKIEKAGSIIGALAGLAVAVEKLVGPVRRIATAIGDQIDEGHRRRVKRRAERRAARAARRAGR